MTSANECIRQGYLAVRMTAARGSARLAHIVRPGHQLSLMMPIRERRICMTVHGGMRHGTLEPTILLVRVVAVAAVANSRSGYGI